MDETMYIYRLLPLIPYLVGILGACLVGVFLYQGLSTKLERRHFRLRIIEQVEKGKSDYKKNSQSSKLEQLFKEANYPLGLNAEKFTIFFFIIFVLIAANYMFLPLLAKGIIYKRFFLAVVLLVACHPSIKFSAGRFALNKIIEYKKAKRNAELFSLYDLLVTEIHMMETNRINMYSVITSITPYFQELGPYLRKLLVEHNSLGAEKAIDNFAENIGTEEAINLATILKTFDESDQKTLLKSLKSMEGLFITRQIENNRQKRKLSIDLAKLPIQGTQAASILNFVIVVIMMAMKIMDSSQLQ